MADSGLRSVGLVLGAGGVLGGAWLTGALHAIASETGWDPGSSDYIVGTSAGAMVGALLACGVPPWFMLAHSAGEEMDGLSDARGESASSADRSAGARYRLHRGLPALGPGSWRLAVSSLARPYKHSPAALLAGWLPHGPISTEPLKDTVRRVCDEPWAPHPNYWAMAVDYQSGQRVALGRAGARRAGAAEGDALSALVVDRHRPVVRVRRPRFVADTPDRVLQRLGRDRPVGQPAGQQGGGRVLVGACKRGDGQPPRARAECRQPAVQAIARTGRAVGTRRRLAAGVAQAVYLLAGRVREHEPRWHAAGEQRADHRPGGGPDDVVRAAGVPPRLACDRVQSAGEPRSAEHAAGAQHQPDAAETRVSHAPTLAASPAAPHAVAAHPSSSRSSATDSTIREARKGWRSASSRVVTPVRTRIVSIPASNPDTMSVSIRSPIIAAVSEWASIALSAERIISGLGLPTKYGSTPVARLMSAATEPVAGSGPSALGPVASGLVAMNRAPAAISRIARVMRSKE